MAKPTCFLFKRHRLDSRPVAPGGAGGAMAPPDFGKSVNPITTRETDYVPTSLLAPPDLQTFLQSCDFFMMSHDASKRDFFNVFIDTKKSATYNYIKANRGCARSWILIMRFTVLGQA